MSNQKDKNEVFGNMISALGVVLDSVDYTSGACRVNEPVGGVLPEVVLGRAKEVLQEARNLTTTGVDSGDICPTCKGLKTFPDGTTARERCTTCKGRGHI